ncbi:MAG TPA: hypothetical protein VMR31_15515 [Myxococcota bacterium]|nr:hypothetical protein [Myxococcota bacterium]
MNALARIGGLALLASGGGCATMFHGTTQTIHFESKPAGAKLTDVVSGDTWTLPAEVTLWRRRHHQLIAELEGYRTEQVYMTREMPLYWWELDALTVGVGAIVDGLSGGFYELGPDPVIIVMEPLAAGPAPAAAAPTP